MVRLTILGEGGAPRKLVLPMERIRIGRDPGNDVALRDGFVSSRHGELRCEGGAWSYRDLASTNGSVLQRGGKRVPVDDRCGRRVHVRDGDVLLLGDAERPVSLLVEVVDVNAAAPLELVPLGEPRTVDEMDVTRLERVDEASARLDREALLALHRLSVRLSRHRSPAELVSAFTEAALEALPAASHVSVHVRGEAGLACVSSRHRRGSATPAPLSRTLRDVVLANGRAIAFHCGDVAFSGAESLHEASVSGGLCAPLHDGERILGFVQADQREPCGRAMGRRELEVLVVLAQHLALALAHARLLAEQQRTCEESIRGLARALEAKDRYTAGHSDAVGELCARVARRMGLPAEQVELMRRAALLHDIGKIGIPEGVLNKADRLSADEFRLLRSHPETGARILEPFTFLADLVPIVLHHHERWDGKGYPSALAGEDIPLGARLLAAVDAYHSLVHDRAYRKGVGVELATWEVQRCAGTQFDPAVVDALAAEVQEEAGGPAEAPPTLRLDGDLAIVE